MLRYLLILLACWQLTTGQAQHNGFTFSDVHNSSLYRVFQLNDFHSFADTTFPVNISALENANSQLIFLSIGIPKYGDKGPRSTTIEEVLTFLRKFKQHCFKNYPQLSFVQNQAQLNLAQQSKKIAVAFALEGSHLLENKMEYVDSLHQIGVAMIGVAHWFCNDFIVNKKNQKAQELGIAKIDVQSQLSAKGKLLIKKLIALNIFIDVSHMQKRLFQQVVCINANRTKLIASHANAFDVYEHPRNLNNKELRQIARSGGLIGICLHQPIIAAKNADLNVIIKHIKHIVSIVGIEHICIGTDLEGNTSPPIELNRICKLKKLANKLLSEEFTEKEVNKIMGANLLTIWSSL